MHTKLWIMLFLLVATTAYGQDKTFSYLTKYEGEQQLKHLADSIGKPLLVTDNKLYVIGSDCLTRLFDGNMNGRDEDGDSDDRNKSGNLDERNKGGGVADRNKKGKNSNRDEDGDVNERNSGAGSDSRNSDGSIAEGPRCSSTKNGKILLYTRQDIKANSAKIYYNHKYYPSKYFKIIKL